MTLATEHQRLVISCIKLSLSRIRRMCVEERVNARTKIHERSIRLVTVGREESKLFCGRGVENLADPSHPLRFAVWS
jgi:hypothetical protein